MLEVDQLTKAYPSPSGPVPVLRSIDLRVAPGERVTVMGPSGSGKSTLLSILGALDEPTSGQVRLDGVDPFAGGQAERASFRNRRVGFVFQEHHLLDGCTAVDNVVLPALASGAVTGALEAIAPLRLAADWDAVGLLVAAARPDVDRVLTCLSLTPEVAAEAELLRALEGGVPPLRAAAE